MVKYRTTTAGGNEIRSAGEVKFVVFHSVFT